MVTWYLCLQSSTAPSQSPNHPVPHCLVLPSEVDLMHGYVAPSLCDHEALAEVALGLHQSQVCALSPPVHECSEGTKERDQN